MVRNQSLNIKAPYYLLFILFALAIGLYFPVAKTVSAQTSGIIWGQPVNISRSPDDTSTDPFLLSDPTGIGHLFWAEKTTNQESNNPDTLMYTQWNGIDWSQPYDIFFAPEEHGNRIVQYPHAALDQQGTIHLIWLSQPNFPNYALFYTSVNASQAKSVIAWDLPTMLEDDLTGTNYSIDIVTNQNNDIHIIYSRVQSGDTAPELRAVSQIKSTDGGETWSEPIDIYTVSDPGRGASNNRLIVDDQGVLYTTWSEWDLSGNGQAIKFSRSTDSGNTWLPAVTLTTRVRNEYERDWNSIALLEDDHLVSFWEGGWRAYRNVMYSYDGGQTWTDSVDAFPGLIGENGFIEFARDGAGTLHIFFANRAREGNTITDGEGLWHSYWRGEENWSEPIQSSPDINMLNPKAVIVGGNQVLTTWYTGAGREIMVMAGEIADAPTIAPIKWPTPTAEPTATVTPTIEADDPIPDTNLTLATPELLAQDQETFSPTTGLIVGLAASSIALLGFILIYILLIKKP